MSCTTTITMGFYWIFSIQSYCCISLPQKTTACHCQESKRSRKKHYHKPTTHFPFIWLFWFKTAALWLALPPKLCTIWYFLIPTKIWNIFNIHNTFWRRIVQLFNIIKFYFSMLIRIWGKMHFLWSEGDCWQANTDLCFFQTCFILSKIFGVFFVFSMWNCGVKCNFWDGFFIVINVISTLVHCLLNH